MSNQIAKLERRVKQEILSNQKLLQDIKEDKRRKGTPSESEGIKSYDRIGNRYFFTRTGKLVTASGNADEKRKDADRVDQRKVLPEEEEKDRENNDKNTQASQAKVAHSVKYRNLLARTFKI